MNNTTFNRTLIFVCTLSSLLMTGCRHIVQPPQQTFTGYSDQEKFHLKVGLNITDELLKAKSETSQGADTWVISIGNSTATNARVLVWHVFDAVVDVNNGQMPANETVDAILTPKVV
jgi:hypothetical protein